MHVFRSASTLVVPLCLTVLLIPPALADDSLVTITSDNWLVSFNPRTGAITQYHTHIPVPFVQGFAWHEADKKIYLVASADSSQFGQPGFTLNTLYSLDAATLQVTRVGG